MKRIAARLSHDIYLAASLSAVFGVVESAIHTILRHGIF